MSVFAVLLAILIGGQGIAESRASFINGRLGTSNYEVIRTESDIDSAYFKSEFRTLGDLVGELQNVAAEIASEGAVLLKNENNALPINKGSEAVTLWGLNSNTPVLGGLIGSSVAVGEGTGQVPYGIKEALLEKGFTVNQEMMDFYAQESFAEYRMKASFFGQEVPGHAIIPAFGMSYENPQGYFVGELPARLYTDSILSSADDTVALVCSPGTTPRQATTAWR